METEVMPIMAWAWKKPNNETALAATWAAVFGWPRPEVMPAVTRPRPAMTAVAQPTAEW